MGNCPNEEYLFLSCFRDTDADHPNIISLLGQSTIQGSNGLHQCFVLEFVGPSLNNMTIREHRLTGRMARNTVRQIAKGLAHLHALGIGHGGQVPLVLTEAQCQHLSRSHHLQHIIRPALTHGLRPKFTSI